MTASNCFDMRRFAQHHDVRITNLRHQRVIVIIFARERLHRRAQRRDDAVSASH